MMKKTFTCRLFLLLILTVSLLCGCRVTKTPNLEDYSLEFSKAQEITAIPAGTDEVIQTLSDTEEIADFVNALRIDEWKLAKLPDGAEEIGSFRLSQESTLKLGQTERDRTLDDICVITLYDNAYVNLEIANVNLAFTISDEAADYLNGYF